MPIPIINKDKGESKYNMDFSFLSSEPIQKTASSSDKDAELLMKIWTRSNRLKDYTYKVSSELSSGDFARLKNNGFVSGEINNCVITNRGKKIITVMTLGEGNAYLKTQKKKSYTEILASNNKKNKNGYRMPKTASEESVAEESLLNDNLDKLMSVNSEAASCLIKNKNGSIRLTKNEWINMGKGAGWVG